MMLNTFVVAILTCSIIFSSRNLKSHYKNVLCYDYLTITKGFISNYNINIGNMHYWVLKLIIHQSGEEFNNIIGLKQHSKSPNSTYLYTIILLTKRGTTKHLHRTLYLR